MLAKNPLNYYSLKVKKDLKWLCQNWKLIGQKTVRGGGQTQKRAKKLACLGIKFKILFKLDIPCAERTEEFSCPEHYSCKIDNCEPSKKFCLF